MWSYSNICSKTLFKIPNTHWNKSTLCVCVVLSFFYAQSVLCSQQRPGRWRVGNYTGEDHSVALPSSQAGADFCHIFPEEPQTDIFLFPHSHSPSHTHTQPHTQPHALEIRALEAHKGRLSKGRSGSWSHCSTVPFRVAPLFCRISDDELMQL